jgi:flagellin-specific chaperone FliS
VTIAVNPNHVTQTYRQHQVMSASPLQLILMAYDAAITACKRKDLKRATDALNVLRNALDLDQGQVAIDLFSLYLYVADLARLGQWDEAANILRELMGAWMQALAQEQQGEEVVQPIN